MKRILFFNDGLKMGGTEILLVDLLNHLVEKECEITLLLPEISESNVLLEKVSSQVSIRYIYPSKISYARKKLEENLMIFFPRIFAKLKKIDEADYDEVVCFKETFFARVFSSMEIYKILWIHNIIHKPRYEIRSLKEKIVVWLNKKHIKKVQGSYKEFDKVICVSDASKEAYLSVLYDGRSPKDNVEVLYNAIDLTKVVEKAREPIADLSQATANFILITRLSADKHIDRLLNASNRLKTEGYDFHILIIGEGVDSSEMKEELRKLNLEDIISLKGRVDNPYPYILQSKWSLCVSERESFSLVLLESMALKTPVITTDCGGPRDIVDKGKYGMLVANNTEGVYEGMKTVLDNPSLSVKYSMYLDEAVARFDYDSWISTVDKLLRL